MIEFILEEGAKLPKRGSLLSAGLDICTLEDVSVPSRDRLLVKTGVFLASCPIGTYLRVAPRSKLANKRGIDVLAGVVDSDYRGEVCVILYNTSHIDVCFNEGEAIAQLIPEVILLSEVCEVIESKTTERGNAGINDNDLRL